jgi:transposase
MSLPHFSTQGSLFSTAALGASLFAETDRYRLFAKLVYPQLIQARPQLEKAYSPDTGRVAVEPVLMLGVSLLQFLDGIPDRQAVELLRYHAGWNFALNRQLGDELFHPTTLSKFRDRLQEHGLAAVGFRAILDGLVDAGLVARSSRQRLDSTQVFGLVSKMGRLEALHESLRLTLGEVGERLAEAERPSEWSGWWSRYVESQVDYRASRERLSAKMEEAGSDAAQLLEWLRARSELAEGEQAKLLARIFQEQFILEDGAWRVRGKGELDSGRVQNPHDPDATYSVKGQGAEAKSHVGYKAQVAETVIEETLQKGEPTRNFLTGIATQPAHGGDEAGAEQMASEQASMGLEAPPVQYVDGAYLSAATLVEAAAQGREVIGPVQSAPQRRENAFTVEDFDVEIEQRRATCPAGKPNDQCSRLDGEAADRAQYRLEWNQSTCAECPLRERCLGERQTHKTIVVGEHHTALQARRREQKTEAFQARMRHRNAIEGTQSELVRAHGLRWARYRGLEKVRLQNYLIGAACNIKRWIRRGAWEMSRTAASTVSSAVSSVAS